MSTHPDRVFIRLLAALCLVTAGGALAGCGSSRGGNEIARLTPQQVKAGLDRDEYIVVDARSDSAYRQSHIEGAMPWSKVNPTTVPWDAMVVLYCS